LCEDANVGSPDHVWLDEFEEGDIRIVAFEFAHILDVPVFSRDEGTVGVAFAMDQSQDGMAIFPSVLAGEPAWRFGEEAHADEKTDGGDHLKAPWNTEGSGTINKAATIGYVEHDQNAPCDSLYRRQQGRNGDKNNLASYTPTAEIRQDAHVY